MDDVKPQVATGVAGLVINEARYVEKGLDYSISSHARDDWQWYHVIYGEVEQQYDQRVYQLRSSCSLLYPPGVLRRPRAVPGQARPPGYICITFANIELELEDLFDQVLTLPATLAPDVGDLVDAIRGQQLPQPHLLQRALLERILLGLVHMVRSEQGSQRPALNQVAELQQVTVAQEFMDQHLGEPITLPDIAAAAHCSVAHLTRLFRVQVGRSVGQCLTAKRLVLAKSLLVGSDASITQIAGQVGYDSYSHFSQLFKREAGISPSAYRRAGGKSWRAVDQP